MRRGFTLIELLVVIGIVAALAVVLILTLNPAQLMKQARDSGRVSDLATLKKAIALYQVEYSTASIGVPDTIYVSVPDSSPTCANLNLPMLPVGYVYSCKPLATYRKTDGTGWIPINLNQLPSGSPLSQLPIDPINSTSTASYYIYTTAGTKYALSTGLESQKYLQTAANDNGYDILRYETGSNLELLSGSNNLLAYWQFDEGSGGTASDSSGNGNTGTLVNGAGWATSGCKRNSCLELDGNNDYVSISSVSSLTQKPVTASLWVNLDAISGGDSAPVFIQSGSMNFAFALQASSKRLALYTGSAWEYASSVDLNPSTWLHLVLVARPSGSEIFFNGNRVYSGSGVAGNGNSTTILGARLDALNAPFSLDGKIDNVRIYNRALSATEIEALYYAEN